MKKDKSISAIAQELGRRGGKKTLKKHGKAHYDRMAVLASEARRLKKEAKEAENID